MIFNMQTSIPIRNFLHDGCGLSLPIHAPILEISLDVYLECLVGSVMLKINKMKIQNTFTTQLIFTCSKSAIKTLGHYVNFEQTSHIVLV